jgi:hypothetical protein
MQGIVALSPHGSRVSSSLALICGTDAFLIRSPERKSHAAIPRYDRYRGEGRVFLRVLKWSVSTEIMSPKLLVTARMES